MELTFDVLEIVFGDLKYNEICRLMMVSRALRLAVVDYAQKLYTSLFGDLSDATNRLDCKMTR